MKEKLHELAEQWKPVDTATLPQKLPLATLETLPELYQPRWGAEVETGVSDERHSNKLTKILKSSEGELDPITVLHVNGRNIVIDGHHRLEAYKKQNREVPVVYFNDSPLKALLEAGRENSKDRLSMSPAEKSQRAWNIVNNELPLSKQEISSGTGVSVRTIGYMRQVYKQLKAEGVEIPDKWNHALRGERREIDDQWLEKEAEEWASRLKKHMPVLSSSGKASIFARAIIGYSPGRAEDIALELVRELDLWEEIKETMEEPKEDYGF